MTRKKAHHVHRPIDDDDDNDEGVDDGGGDSEDDAEVDGKAAHILEEILHKYFSKEKEKEEVKDEHWKPVLKAMRKLDKKSIDSMKDDVGNLLVFTGLFSAVVTAFAVFSLMAIQPQPPSSSDQTVQLLAQTVASR
ncbi:hypothetical protein NM688_g1180 [Phlebia brevispora]|uniref:Uncharacterized protein n=1 Tax=Phlebia brevispora TaxID=194682 RepID=A0ACC1TCI9_9APHY|nr:hypothetical protein NM688_g1180 [Phlebia brevispora]